MVNQTAQTSVHAKSLGVRMLQGAGLITALTAMRLLSGFEHASAGSLAKMVVAVPVAGAAGGAAYYATDGLRAKGGGAQTFANVVSMLAYCAAALVAALLLFPS